MNTFRYLKSFVKLPRKSFSKPQTDNLRAKYDKLSEPKRKKVFKNKYFYIGFAFNLAFVFFLFVSKDSDSFSFSPSRAISRFTGKLAALHLPVFLRNTVFNLYITKFGVIKEDLIEEDLTKYPSIQAFFTREIKVLL